MPETLKNLQNAKKLFEKEPAFIELDPGDKEIIVVGDLHSDFEAANLVSKFIFFCRDSIFVFLGDYIDRQMKEGDGIQTILKLLKWKQRCPDRVFLLRGNHEFAEVNGSYGFREDVFASYDEETWNKFNGVFDEMPIALRTTTGVLMLHGGLPDISSYEEMKNLPKTTQSEENKFVDQIVWNDCLPRKTALLAIADRGVPNTFTYGQDFFEEKMKILKSNILIRGHQPNVKGAIFGARCITLLTCKIYEKFPYTHSKYYKLLTPPLNGRPIAVIPPRIIHTAKDLKFHDVLKYKN